MLKKLNPKLLIIGIILLTAALRLYNINYPNNYVFDEVYHGFTAREYLKWNVASWEYWTTPPPGVAYEWTHPPLAKEIMALSMFVLRTTDNWAYRLPGVLLGVLSVFLVYLIAKTLFKNEQLAILSGLIFSFEGLTFVQSRTGMNDIYFLSFMLLSILFFLKKRYLFSAIFFGLMISSKWAGIYLLGVYFLLLLFSNQNGSQKNLSSFAKQRTCSFFKENTFKVNIKNLIYFPIFIIIPTIIYLLIYAPFFMMGHSLEQFKNLQQQMWWYHTGLKATHGYASPWWSWPFNLYPVWYFVDYHKNGAVSNIFASGNPIIFWLGFGAILATAWDFITSVRKPLTLVSGAFIKHRSKMLGVILLGFFAFWLPWALSPRIMFLYHYSPSVPFLSLALAYQLGQIQGKAKHKILIVIIGLIIIGFLLLYPFLIGIPLPRDTMLLFFRTNLTKNPFI